MTTLSRASPLWRSNLTPAYKNVDRCVMREKFEEVLALQLEHSSLNTPSMMRRGQLIRVDIPEEMRLWPAASAEAVLPFRGRLNVQGRDGTGLKTFVPWVRIHSPELSPSAQSGWYVVYLFRQDGSGVSLCISHGSTRFDGGDFKPRSAGEAAELMRWGRALLGQSAAAIGMAEGVELASSEKLSRAYEATTAFSKFYPAGSIPDDAILAADASAAVGLLGELYRALELGRAPDSDPPEVLEAEDLVARVSRPGASTAKGGQGFGLSAAERAVVEAHAMNAAQAWLTANGYSGVRDVHKTHSCDFIAVKGGVEHHVEVKGTTAGPGQILLTANEVDLHRKSHPNNVLIVVYNIELHAMRTQAHGGQIMAREAWDLNQAHLRPLSYVCRLR